MRPVTALLVRYKEGYAESLDAPHIAADGRKEGYLELADASSQAEVDRIAEGTFALTGATRWAIKLGVEPEAGSEPYVDWSVGDTITAPNQDGAATELRVVALTVSEDLEGNPAIVPEVGDIIEDPGERYALWLARMANGSLRGVSASAQPLGGGGSSSSGNPIPATPPVFLAPLPPFSYPGPVAVSTSGRFYLDEAFAIASVRLSLKTVGTTATTVQIQRNGANVGAPVVLAAGANTIVAARAVALVAGDYLQVACTGAGTGAGDLDVQLSP